MSIRRRSCWILALLLAAPSIAACARGDEPSSAPDKGQPPASATRPPDGLVRLDPVAPVWIDAKRKRVVMVAKVCLREGALEMFACPRGTKEHESVLAVPVQPLTLHAGLLAVGALPGNPARWHPKFEPARAGTPIEVTLFWTDEQGMRQRARGQDWVRQLKTGTAMDKSWVFGGSQLLVDEPSGEKRYLADYGEFICISNFPGAMLDVPVASSNQAGELQFEAFTDRIPPLGTKVTLVLTPKPESDAEAKQADDGAPKEP